MSAGGKRKNAGAKPLPKGMKKETVVTFIQGYKIEALGGLEATKKEIIDHIDSIT